MLRKLIVVNAHESAGRWKVSPTCHGSLTLDSVSGGYHHYRRRVASGASCLGGDIDCLMRTGVNMSDWVTPRPGGYALNGTLHREEGGLRRPALRSAPQLAYANEPMQAD